MTDPTWWPVSYPNGDEATNAGIVIPAGALIQDDPPSRKVRIGDGVTAGGFVFADPALPPGVPGALILLPPACIATSPVPRLSYTALISGTFDRYRFDLSGIQLAVPGDMLVIEISEDMGATWKSAVGSYGWNQVASRGNGTLPYTGGASANIPMTSLVPGIGSQDALDGHIELWRPASATLFKNIFYDVSLFDTAGTIDNVRGSGKYLADTNPITGISVRGLAGNIVGKLSAYGVTPAT